jgi:hypothetical protein
MRRIDGWARVALRGHGRSANTRRQISELSADRHQAIALSWQGQAGIVSMKKDGFAGRLVPQNRPSDGYWQIMLPAVFAAEPGSGPQTKPLR